MTKKTPGAVTMKELSEVAAEKCNESFARDLVSMLKKNFSQSHATLKAAVIAAFQFLNNWSERKPPHITDVTAAIAA